MSKYMITPWRTHADLLQVRSQLYDLNNDDRDGSSRRRAINRVMAWKQRGNLPHAVESTALLVDAVLHHDTGTSAGYSSPFAVRAVYSAAFCRFVTGFCDIGRHRERSLEPGSMLDVARRIAMPADFVALRHEATHEELPGLRRLAAATERAMEWLWKVYWSRLGEEEGVEGVARGLEDFRAEVTTVLKGFRKVRRTELSGKRPDPAGSVAETGDACVAACGVDGAKVQALAAVLVEGRMLLPSSRELGSSLEGAFLMWDGLLEWLSESLPRFQPSLVDCLLEALTKPATTVPEFDVEKEALVMWVERLADVEPSSMSTILQTCCLHPGYWTRSLGRHLLQICEESVREDWQELFDASFSDVSASTEVQIVDAGSESRIGVDEPVGPRQSASEERTIEHAESLYEGGWTRAILPVSAPIGVVR